MAKSKKWTEEEIELLMKMVKEGASENEIFEWAKFPNRTFMSIRNAVQRLPFGAHRMHACMHVHAYKKFTGDQLKKSEELRRKLESYSAQLGMLAESTHRWEEHRQSVMVSPPISRPAEKPQVTRPAITRAEVVERVCMRCGRKETLVDRTA